VAIVAGLSFLLGLGLNQLILLFIHRLRPYDAGRTHLLIRPGGVNHRRACFCRTDHTDGKLTVTISPGAASPKATFAP
jgi:hypothetical protein